MRIRISFRTSILFGIAGWILMGYPRWFLLYDQIVSGEFFRIGYRFLPGGTVDSATVMAGLSLLPIAPVVLLAVLYLDDGPLMHTSII